jgi:FkbM family methyltransferase
VVGELTKGILGRAIVTLKVIQNYKNWHTFALDHFGILRNREVVYLLRNSIRFWARAGGSDAGVINEVWLRKRYTPVGDEIKEGDVVVDIGAHIGVFSIFAATCAKGVRVYSYEPFLQNFNLLKHNIALNRLDNIKPFSAAIASTREKRRLSVDTRDSVAHTLIPSGQHSIEVDCLTLRDIFEANDIEMCGFLKMDCEGAEYEILFNTPKEIFTRIERICVEYHPDVGGYRHSPSGEELVELLEKMGFEVRSVILPRAQGCDGHIYASNKRCC